MMISDNKAIREALVTKSTDFAGRPVFNFDSILNPRMKGTVMMLPALCAWGFTQMKSTRLIKFSSACLMAHS